MKNIFLSHFTQIILSYYICFKNRNWTSLIHIIISFYRWMLWIDQKTNYCWRMGMGMVVSDRCSTSIPRSHDFESDVRGRRNSTRCTTHCNWRRSVQNNEGMDIRDVSCWTIILFFFKKNWVRSQICDNKYNENRFQRKMK